MKLTSMQHLNGNLLCSVDIETTGLRAGYHELIQLGIVPLDGNIKPCLEPFDITVQCEVSEHISKQAMKINKINLTEITIDRWDGQAMFEDWFEKIVIGNGFKKVSMLGQNLNFDIPFMKEFFDFSLEHPEKDNMSLWFDTRNIRDTKRSAEYLNDLAYFRGLDFPFPKTNLKYLCNRFGIKTDNAHDALTDAYHTAEVYRCLLALRLDFMDFGAVG